MVLYRYRYRYRYRQCIVACDVASRAPVGENVLGAQQPHNNKARASFPVQYAPAYFFSNIPIYTGTQAHR